MLGAFFVISILAHNIKLSFLAFPAIGPSVQSLPALHPFEEGSHCVLFGGVHCGLRLFNGWHFVLSVIPQPASRQQQDGRGGHCYYRDKGFLYASHGMLLLHHLAHTLLSTFVGDGDKVDARR